MGRGSSKNRVISSTVIILSTIIANLLLSATTATAFSLWPYHHVHVTNELTGGKVLLAHCKSATSDLGVQEIAPTKEFTWRFRPGFAFVSTLYWCYVAPDGSHHLRFDAWTDHVAGMYEYDRNMYWVAKDDGLYVRVPTRGDLCWLKWDQGRMEQEENKIL
ncbi:unnamed protein product [Linum trigynum]|uniref:S-protein homolog n=1 Tax=Linum trigynum TaxID=586398 RepID=A0AAV2F4Q5_9ROSI